ncbi:tetratricopeptide repeat protein [Roseivirga sp. BDSF3-8]|uniref:tetratricopeptide repeat-containing sensor histidine kinase n=1 Tax=Roseivirga sp. BDSF3-8 TaxID=3241598 RepID=UPI003531B066
MKLRIFLFLNLLLFSLRGFTAPYIVDSLYRISEGETDGEYFRQEAKKLAKEGRLEEAMAAFEEAISLFKEANDSLGVAEALNSRGVAYKNASKFLEAVDDYLLAATINQSMGELAGLANNYTNLGNYYADSGQPDKAMKYLQKALRLYKQTGDQLRVNYVANSLGTLYYTEGYEDYNLDSAAYYLQIAYDGFEELGATLYLPGIKQNFGMIEESRGNPETALTYYLEAREGFSNMEDYHNLPRVGINIGVVYLNLDQPEEALNILGESKEIALQYGDMKTYQSLEEWSIRAYLRKGNTLQAERSFNIYDSLKEADTQNRVREKIEEMEARYQNDLKEQELATKEAALVQSLKEKNTLYTFLSIVLILTVLIIVFYSQRQRALKQLAEKQTKLHHNEISKMLHEHEQKRLHAMLDGQEKERYRIATDLHDRLGNTLSAVKLHMNAYDHMAMAGNGSECNGQRDKMGELLDRAVNEVREISHNMLSGVLTKFGLSAALEDLKETLESSQQYRVHLQIINLHDRIENTLELNLYRIVQELVSNIMKHAEATMITIQVNKLDDEIILLVEDDGVGFTPGAGTGDGVGLQNVADRVRSLNGHLHVDAQPGRGASITAEIPTP